jgi:hypothetical protein
MIRAFFYEFGQLVVVALVFTANTGIHQILEYELGNVGHHFIHEIGFCPFDEMVVYVLMQ